MITGRPTVMTPETLALLIEGFSYGFTDSEACLYANIAPATLYTYCKEHPEFTEQKEELKNNPLILAKRNVVDSLKDKDKDTSKWYLERKAKHEFSTRSEVETTSLINATIEITNATDQG